MNCSKCGRTVRSGSGAVIGFSGTVQDVLDDMELDRRGELSTFCSHCRKTFCSKCLAEHEAEIRDAAVEITDQLPARKKKGDIELVQESIAPDYVAECILEARGAGKWPSRDDTVTVVIVPDGKALQQMRISMIQRGLVLKEEILFRSSMGSEGQTCRDPQHAMLLLIEERCWPIEQRDPLVPEQAKRRVVKVIR